MGIYLKTGTTDLSRFITENAYSVTSVPVYDEDSEYTNIYGERIRSRLGRNITVSARLCDVDDDTAAALSEIASAGGKINTVYSDPTEKTAMLEMEKYTASLDRVYKGEKFWTADIVLCGFVGEEGL